MLDPDAPRKSEKYLIKTIFPQVLIRLVPADFPSTSPALERRRADPSTTPRWRSSRIISMHAGS